MPIYDYKCESNHMTELKLPMLQETPSTTSCKNCGSVAKRVFVAPVVEFKGDGFYTNDKKVTIGTEL
jgi:putative FmdB family regulatory protein